MTKTLPRAQVSVAESERQYPGLRSPFRQSVKNPVLFLAIIFDPVLWSFGESYDDDAMPKSNLSRPHLKQGHLRQSSYS